MSLFDWVKFDYDIGQTPEELESGFHSKDLDCAMRTYTIHADGSITVDNVQGSVWSGHYTDDHDNLSYDIYVYSKTKDLCITCVNGKVTNVRPWDEEANT